MLGKPLILSDCVGAKFLLDTGGGWLTENGNVTSIKNAIKDAIDCISKYSLLSNLVYTQYELYGTEKSYIDNLQKIKKEYLKRNSGNKFITIRRIIEYYKVYFKNPFYRKKLPYKSRLLIYGAGKYGKAWKYILNQSKYYKVVAWVDVAVTNSDVIKLENVDLKKVDYVLITINDKSIRREIKDMFMELGFDRERIMYQKDCSNELEGY